MTLTGLPQLPLDSDQIKKNWYLCDPESYLSAFYIYIIIRADYDVGKNLTGGVAAKSLQMVIFKLGMNNEIHGKVVGNILELSSYKERDAREKPKTFDYGKNRVAAQRIEPPSFIANVFSLCKNTSYFLKW